MWNLCEVERLHGVPNNENMLFSKLSLLFKTDYSKPEIDGCLESKKGIFETPCRLELY